MMAHSDIAVATIFAGSGALFGWGYFATLRRTARYLCAGGRALCVSALTIGRLVAAAVFLWLAARAGAWPLLTALFGFLAARWVAVHAVRAEGHIRESSP